MLRSLTRVSSFLLVLGAAQQRYDFTEVHMGMPVRIVLYADSDSAARSAARAAFRRIAELDDTFSDYRPQSEARRLMDRAGSWVSVSGDLFEVLSRSIEIAELTGGAFDVTVGPAVQLWRNAKRSGVHPLIAQIDSAKALVGWRRIALDSATRKVYLTTGTQLDFGGIAKGYIIGEAQKVLANRGIRSIMIEAGGDIVVGDAPPGERGWRISAPGASVELEARLSAMTNRAISTSGTWPQAVAIRGQRYSHIIDPRSARPLTHAVTARVVGSHSVSTDAAATAALLVGAERVREIRGIEWVELIGDDCGHFGDWKPAPPNLADSSLDRIFVYATHRRGLADLLRPYSRPRSREKLDTIADRVAQLAITAIRDGDGDAFACVTALSEAGRRPGPNVEGIAYGGAADRLIRIHRETPADWLITRASILRALVEVTDYERNIAYLRDVVRTSDVTAPTAVQALIEASAPGVVRDLTPSQKALALQIIRELWSSVAPSMDPRAADSAYAIDRTAIERAQQSVPHPHARLALFWYAVERGWTVRR